jgi:hypothetical protein
MARPNSSENLTSHGELSTLPRCRYFYLTLPRTFFISTPSESEMSASRLVRPALAAARRPAPQNLIRTYATPAAADTRPPIAVYGLDGTYASALVWTTLYTPPNRMIKLHPQTPTTNKLPSSNSPYHLLTTPVHSGSQTIRPRPHRPRHFISLQRHEIRPQALHPHLRPNTAGVR